MVCFLYTCNGSCAKTPEEMHVVSLIDYNNASINELLSLRVIPKLIYPLILLQIHNLTLME